MSHEAGPRQLRITPLAFGRVNVASGGFVTAIQGICCTPSSRLPVQTYASSAVNSSFQFDRRGQERAAARGSLTMTETSAIAANGVVILDR